jgi:hypothetical protein
VAAATRSMARSMAGEAIWPAVLTAATFRTYWRAADSTSSAVAGGSRPRSGVMFRHMPSTIRRLLAFASPDEAGCVPERRAGHGEH